jgi:hypothetical protein
MTWEGIAPRGSRNAFQIKVDNSTTPTNAGLST